MAESNLKTDEIEADIKRLINFNSDSGCLSVSVVMEKNYTDSKESKGSNSPKAPENTKYFHERGIAASTQEVVDALLPNCNTEKKSSHKRRSDGDIFTETTRKSSSNKSEYGPQKCASAKVMEERVVLKAKRKHISQNRTKNSSLENESVSDREETLQESGKISRVSIENEIDTKAVKKCAVSTAVKSHHRQESPEVLVNTTSDSSDKMSAAVRKFLEIPEQKSKKKKKKKPKKKGDNKVDKNEEDKNDEIAEEIKKKPVNEKAKSVQAETGVPCNVDKLQTQKILEHLERERIFPLKKKSLRFPRAVYFCRLCDYHMDTVLDCDKHINDNRHSRRKEIFQIEAKLSKLPPTTAGQITAMDKLVDSICERFSLTEQEMEYRQQLAENLQTFLNESLSELKDVSLVLYGSSKSGFGVKDSDVNIDLLVKGEQNQARALTLAYKVMKESEDYKEVKSDFSAKVPCIYFRDIKHRLHCQLTITGAMSPKTTNLLRVYADLDPRVRKLGVIIRHFAKICKIDKQEEGTLPSYCYAVMVVYYLQHCKPCVLPVLSKATEVPSDQEESRSPTKKKMSPSPADLNIDNIQETKCWKSENKDSAGSLWIGLLKFYSLDFDNSTSVISIRQKGILSRAEKKWNTKRIAIEDPFSPKRNTARSVTNYEVFQYIWDCFRKAYFYFSLPTNYNQLTRKQKNMLHKQKSKVKEQLRNTKSSSGDDTPSSSINIDRRGSTKDCGKLDSAAENIDNVEDDSSSDSVVILSEDDGEEDGEEDEEGCKPLTIDDESQSKFKEDGGELEVTKDATQCIDGSTVGYTSQACEQVDLDVVQTNECSDTKDISETLETLVLDSSCDSCEKKQDNSGDDTSPSLSDDPEPGQNVVRDLVNEVVLKGMALLNVSDETVIDIGKKITHDPSEIQEMVIKSGHHGDQQETEKKSIEKEQSSEDEESEVKGSSVSLPTHTEGLPPLQYDYIFNENNFTDGKGPLVVCSICDKEGHLKSACPEEALPDLKPLPSINKKSMLMLTETIKKVPRDFGLTNKDYKDREAIRQELEDFIRELYPVAELHLFGSSDNGFGFKQSDLDLCVTFQDKKTCEGLDLVGIIEEIAKKLKAHKGLYNVFPITTAKVPIVKFRHRWSQLEGDISLYNLLALHNTRMIMMYSNLDPRVRSLGYALKVFAKVCEIGDASRGSLSSYAYVLMLIYYLQQCKPPVLPVLQELFPGKDKPERIVDGWNAWYFDNEGQVPKIFRSKNNQSVGELWRGLFIFYTEEFCLKDHVVCIRQHELLTRFEKLWNGKCIAIEDPFDLSHNLGGGLSRKMNQYIMKALIHGRMLYGTPIQGTPENLSDYFFDKSHLTEGNPPNDRCCRVCNKIGHIAKECPRVQLRKERDEKRKDENRMKEDRRREERRRYEEQRNQKVIKRSGSDPNGQEREFQSYQRQNVVYNRSMSYPEQRMVNSGATDRQNAAYSRPSSNHHAQQKLSNSPPVQGGYSPHAPPGFPQQVYNRGPVPGQFQGNRPNSSPHNFRTPGFVTNQQRPTMSPGKSQFGNQQNMHPWVQQYLPPQRHGSTQQNVNIPLVTPRQQGPTMNPVNPGILGYGSDMYQGGVQRIREPQQVYRPPHQRRK